MDKNYSKPIVYIIGLFFIALPLWIDRYFGSAGLDQLLITIKFGVNGLISSDTIFIKKFIKWCVIGPIVLAVSLLLLERAATRYSLRWLKRLFQWQLHWVIFLSGFVYAFQQFHVSDYLRGKWHYDSDIDYYKQHYLNPKQVEFQLNHPKSLVLIYVESLESTYADTHLFEHNLLKQLDSYKQRGLSFEKFRQVGGTGWTIAGLVATQCAVPLKSVTVFGNNRQGEIMNQFLSGATCLSDILAEKGYQNIFMKGASLRFGGVGPFAKTHHYAEVYGKDEWLAAGESADVSGWGVHDDTLFMHAKKRLAALIASGKLFNLTLTTVDTHGVDGYLNQYCRAKGFHGFTGVVECTANQVADFVHYIKQQGWQDKVAVIVIGDHLSMKNPVYEKLQSAPSRYIYNLIITSAKFTKRTDEITHFDMLPTILNVIGVHFAGDHLGLGYSAIVQPHQPDLPVGRIAEFESMANNDSETYNRLW